MFSGHMPIVVSKNKAIERIYYNAVLTILTCKREYKNAKFSPCYLTLWPRRGEGSGYLAWETAYTSGVLSRLDPDVLLKQWELLTEAPFLDYQVTNFLSGEHGGWTCCAHPSSIYIGALNLLKWSGNDDWKNRVIKRKKKTVKGFEAASQGQVNDIKDVDGFDISKNELTGLDVFREAALIHRVRNIENTNLVDFGDRSAYVECITTYSHGTAGHSALQAFALTELGKLEEKYFSIDIKGIIKDIMDLYNSEGYFNCLHEKGKTFPAANLYDIGLVLNSIGHLIPESIVEKLIDFVKNTLKTDTWAHCLSPIDFDVVSGIRCDHQWAGCFPAWISQFILGISRIGYNDKWVNEWIDGISKITLQGPFAQAYWTEDLYDSEFGAASKCFDELTQGNHWVIGSGVHFAEMVLDGIFGLNPDYNGNLSIKNGIESIKKVSEIYNISVAGNLYHYINGEIVIK